jgi:Tol biopolymer transport system component
LSDLDERIRRAMEGATAPADPAGAYERVTRKRARRRAVRRAQTIGLTVAVVIVSSGVTFTLGRIFGSDRPDETAQTPTPPARSFLALAFASDRGGDLDIYLASADGQNVRRVTDDPDDDLGPAWSPDGTRIAFTRGLEDDPNIFVMNSDGSGVVQLTDDPADDADPAWSPDGTSIAFVSTREGDTDVYLMNPDGTAQRRLTEDPASTFDPAWSPDGTQLFFARDEHDGEEQADIWVLGMDDEAPRPVVGGPGSETQPAPSPDGTQLAFVSDRDGTAQIYVMDVPLGNPHRVTDTPAEKSRPSWSPDGKQIVFSAGDQKNQEVFVIDADGSNLHRLTDDPGNDVTPEWNPVAEAEPSPPSGELPPCGTDEFTSRIGEEGAGGSLIPIVVVEHLGSSPCRANVEITLRIEDSDGNLLDIEDNPARATLAGNLPEGAVGASWQWRNWCGRPVDVVYRIDTPGRVDQIHKGGGTPPCTAPEEASTLVPIPYTRGFG